ncbi:MAG: SDR family NAD(P)-dependent oxidoreductase [Solirubrobacterales bacterium]|nr:SDR family NAD(P)-dependent oxidoreductase [Solirubrobacterales bacterium]MBV9715558.1 SDR family NAD(P)-dependent oxidoreductase [Solirubrobacterales bacterium]
MERRFEAKSFRLTGAGTGFGAQLAVRAAQEGAHRVLLRCRSSTAGAERTASASTADAELVRGDITSWSDIKTMAECAFAARLVASRCW